MVIVKFMTNHDNFFSQYFLCVLDPLLGSAACYQKISRPPFTRGSRGYAAAQPMFLLTSSNFCACLVEKMVILINIKLFHTWNIESQKIFILVSLLNFPNDTFRKLTLTLINPNPN